MYSPTNAELLLGSGLDAVIVIAPMSAHADALRHGPDRFARARFTKVFAQQRRLLEAAGIEVFAFEPRDSSLKAMGMYPLRRTNGKAIVRSAYLDAARSPEFTSLRTLLAA